MLMKVNKILRQLYRKNYLTVNASESFISLSYTLKTISHSPLVLFSIRSMFIFCIGPVAGKRSKRMVVEDLSSVGLLYWPSTITGFCPSGFIIVFFICEK